MTIEIINEEPDPSVLKEVICSNCGVKLRYAPVDVKHDTHYDYGGGSDTYSWIKCPKCRNTIDVTRN